MLHARDHRLAVLADGVAAHHATLSALTGWTITPAAVTDDRLGRLLEVLGEDTSQITAVQQALGRHVISGWRVKTKNAKPTPALSKGQLPEEKIHAPDKPADHPGAI